MKISEIATCTGFAVIEGCGYEYTFANGDYLSINTDDGGLPDDNQTHARVGRYDKHGGAVEGHQQEGTVISAAELMGWIDRQKPTD